MKRFFSIALAFLMLIVCFIPSYAADSKLSVSADKTTADVGDTITVKVSISANSGLSGLDFNLNYDTSCFQYVSSSTSSLFEMPVINDSVSGKVRFSGISSGVVTSAGELLTVKFKVLKTEGKLSVTFIEACDGDNNPVNNVGTSSLTIKCAHGKAQWTVTKKATCTQKGVETRNCSCGNVATREIPMTEHTVGTYKTIKEATCTEKGEQLATCSVCNKEYKKEIPVKSHNFSEWSIIKEATETENGSKERLCKDCGKKETLKIAMLGSADAGADAITDTTTVTDSAVTDPETESTTEPQQTDTVKQKKTISLTSALLLCAAALVIGVGCGVGIMIGISTKKKEDEK